MPDEIPIATPETAIATTAQAAEGDAAVAAAAAAADAEIQEDIEELTQADAALATWMGDLDEKVDTAIAETKGLGEWARQFQTAMQSAVDGLGKQIETLSTAFQAQTKPATQETKPANSASPEQTTAEKIEEPHEPKKEPEEPLLDARAGSRKKKIGWI